MVIWSSSRLWAISLHTSASKSGGISAAVELFWTEREQGEVYKILAALLDVNLSKVK